MWVLVVLQALAIYNELWAWFTRDNKASTKILCPRLARSFYDCTSTLPWAKKSPPTEKDLDPITIVKHTTRLRGYTVTAVTSRNTFAAQRMAETLGAACQAHAERVVASANAVKIVPSITVPVTAVPAVVGKHGSAISALEATCGMQLYVLPIGDTVGTHAVYAPVGSIVTQYQWLTIMAAVKSLEASTWKSIRHRPLAVGNTYRVRTPAGVVGAGGPLLLVRITRGQLIFREATGVVHACPRNTDTLLAQV